MRTLNLFTQRSAKELRLATPKGASRTHRAGILGTWMVFCREDMRGKSWPLRSSAWISTMFELGLSLVILLLAYATRTVWWGENMAKKRFRTPTLVPKDPKNASWFLSHLRVRDALRSPMRSQKNRFVVTVDTKYLSFGSLPQARLKVKHVCFYNLLHSSIDIVKCLRGNTWQIKRYPW